MRPIDLRTDVYGAGVVLFECLTGEVPFSGTPTAMIASILAGQRPPPIRGKRDDVPLALEAVVRTALEIDPDVRYASARELAAACVEAVGGAVPALELLGVRDDRAMPAPAPRSDEKQTAMDNVLRRRQFARAPYMAPVRLILEGGKSIDGRTEDVSEGGVLVVTDKECEREQRVKIRLPLPSSGRVVVVDAITRWVKTHRNQRAIGAELVGASDEVRADIRSYVAAMGGAPQKVPAL
jgi:hypothetical protein